mmetsp:Transcript_13141/g.23518  ORF Transcript_13141/g.23518 Transcript_13141/m.23518 type:complete len:181 (-) Transcript_13141:172-714(-)
MIRGFEITDLKELFEHDRRMTRELIGDHATPYDEDWLRKLTAPNRERYRSYNTLVAADTDNHPIGFAILRIHKRALQLPHRARRGHFVDIFFLSVAPGHQRQGIGSRLIDDAERWAAAQDAVELRLAVMDSNTDAIRFYERNGFEEIGLMRDYPEDGVLSHRMRRRCNPSLLDALDRGMP